MEEPSSRISRPGTGKSSPTLLDVARTAGVSTATVSRCLNSPERVVEKTRVRVLKAVEDLGYSPNFSARALAAKQTRTIGAIIPTMENAIFARGIQAFQEALDAEGFTLLIASSSYQPELEAAQIRTLLARGADALLLIGFDRDPEIYEFLKQRDIPFVVSWAYREHAHEPSVGFDNRAAMTALASEVFNMGHREVAVISAPQDENDRARDRVLGVGDAAQQNGLGASKIPVIEVPYSVENGAAAMRELLASQTRPTAVLCGNDVLAVGAIRAAKELGLRVPDDVSVTGFDDIELAEIVEPALTTVHVPHRLMGRTAAELVLGLVRGEPIATTRPLETRIETRASLGKPPIPQ